MTENNFTELTKAQMERIEKNKKRAFTLRKTQILTHPYSKRDTVTKVDKTTLKIGNTKYKDTGGGFLLEDEVDTASELAVCTHIPPVFEPDRPSCKKCKKVFANSWLFDTFDYNVCDNCKDTEVHKLITKTDAMNKYLLKECDISKREPLLKFIKRKNPHNSRWGDMKLYLQIQIEERALEIWGSEEKLQEELDGREEKRIEAKTKKYQKEMKQLRMNMRSSLYDKTSAISHTHEFGPESYNEEDDTYTHKCLTCGYIETFEKM